MAKPGNRDAPTSGDPLVEACAAELGRNLRAIRRSQNLSQERLGLMVKTKHSRISNIERGLVNPRFSDIVELARALNVGPGELIDFAAFDPADYPLPPDDHARL